ncbi:MAG TPA: hypothetical protein VK901_21955 [Nitrospiraceae bacterium]|nr:hypothetical protein [Nitrospiraceae bacterium]
MSLSFRDRLVPPIDLSLLSADEREAYARGLEAGADQLSVALDIDRLTIMAALREQALNVRAWLSKNLT